MGSSWSGVLRTRAFHAFLYRFIRLYSSTFRIRIDNEAGWLDYLRNGGRVLLCVWHQQFFPAIRHFQNYRDFKPSLMISRSRDGELIAGVAERSGWHAVRGSSSKGGREALKMMVDRLKRHGLAGHILDGPRGPAGQVKAGAIQLAHAADAVIVPFYTSADKAWYFNSWDSFFIPKPFANVHIRFGATISFPPAADAAQFENQRLTLEKTMRPELRKK
mgnify:FL=1|jgi:hypothetical protein